MKYRDRIQAKRSFKKALLVTATTMTLGLGTVGGTTSAFADVAVSETATETTAVIPFNIIKQDVGKSEKLDSGCITLLPYNYKVKSERNPDGVSANIWATVPNLEKNKNYKLVVTAKTATTQTMKLNFVNKENKEFTLNGGSGYQKFELPFTTDSNPTGDNGTVGISLTGFDPVSIQSIEVIPVSDGSGTTGTSTALTFGQFKFSPEVGKLNPYTDHIYKAGVGEFIDVLQLVPSHSQAKTSINLTGLEKNTKY
ncbi:TPA: hypothetical protein ROY17_005437, partial [Bacillus thuringiensis]|nr:hypothetical protein [Bacillus thuringiensis]